MKTMTITEMREMIDKTRSSVGTTPAYLFEEMARVHLELMYQLVLRIEQIELVLTDD